MPDFVLKYLQKCLSFYREILMASKLDTQAFDEQINLLKCP